MTATRGNIRKNKEHEQKVPAMIDSAGVDVVVISLQVVVDPAQAQAMPEIR